ncbi:MAG: hypothetical protein IPG91_13020 [Ideonella sp.]|nr:hypothetical protein [Ideonella sp.]
MTKNNPSRDVAEGLDVLFHLVAVFRLGDQHPARKAIAGDRPASSVSQARPSVIQRR